jgi:hypothetical protein
MVHSDLGTIRLTYPARVRVSSVDPMRRAAVGALTYYPNLGQAAVTAAPAAASTGPLGVRWWVWLLALVVLGGGVYYFVWAPGTPPRRAGRQRVGGAAIPVPAGPPSPGP